MVDLSSLVELLSAVSSIAVIAGAVFVVFQLRQNARLIQATIVENKTNSSIALLEKITDESFARRRRQMHEAIRKYSAKNWEGFDDSLEDFEARNFAYTYELIGQLARDGLIDFTTVRNALQYLVVVDWDVFEPLSRHVMARYGVSVNAWGNFKWLAEETRKYMREREQAEASDAHPDQSPRWGRHAEGRFHSPRGRFGEPLHYPPI